MADAWTNIPEAARVTGIPERSLRRYLERHGTLLPARRQGRTLQVATEALPVLRRMRELYDSGMSAEQVEATLADAYTRTLTVVADDGRSVAEEATKALQRMADTVAGVAELLREQERRHIEALEQARQEAARAAQEAAATREALERLQAAQERQAEALREWLEKRLPEPQAKRMGLVARVKAILWGDRKHGEL